jgi:nicotinate-nucleotide adenylyltransferase
MKKMALFGGTFDPIHRGHITMALRLADALGLDEVILMPTFVPPHKIKDSLADSEHRLAMCRIAASAHPILSVSDMEIARGGASFTVDTLAALAAQHPDAEWYLIVGADMFCTLRTWYRFGDIAKIATFCTVPRDGTDTTALLAYAEELTAQGVRCYVADRPVEPFSSTEIRRRLAAGESIGEYLPDGVADYIRQHGLYLADTDMRDRDEQYRQIIRQRLGDYRYHHSLCVADEAKRLALRYGADEKKAYTAGLLHDIMKDTDRKSQLQILADFGILLDEVEQQVDKLWHAKVGAAFIEHILPVTDRALLDAVRYHTTGRAGMSLLERIVFVADFTSADRRYPDVDEVRRLSDISLEETMIYTIDYTIRDLLDRGQAIHPDTLAAYNERILERQTGGLKDE